MSETTMLETIRDLLRQRGQALDTGEYLAKSASYEKANYWKREAITLMGRAGEQMAILYPYKSAEERQGMLDFAATLINL